jgi:hypothetical protein
MSKKSSARDSRALLFAFSAQDDQTKRVEPL